MAQQHTNFEAGSELTYLSQKDAYLGKFLRRLVDAMNTSAQNAGVSAVGKFPTPPPVDTIDVQGTFSSNSNTITTPSEILHWTLTHNQQIHKGIKYFTEVDTDPSFSNPHVIDHGTSRSGFLTLPTMDNDGATQNYYMRSYAQYPGSDPSEKTILGGTNNPTAIVMTGTSKTSLLTSKGSGTAKADGQQGGQGLGKVLTRPATGPKRSVVQHS
jgi:hypothetical protein